MTHDKFVALILTHGRPDRVFTIPTLRKSGYTGPILLVVDNEDEKATEYTERFGAENVHVFDKQQAASLCDVGDNFDGRRGVIYARNSCFDIAKEHGYKLFIELDDDYTKFYYKATDQMQYVDHPIKHLDPIFDALVDFLLESPAHSIAIAQGGDFIGGKESKIAKDMKPLRKVMNTFVCTVDRPFKFYGRINEDVTAYVLGGSTGLIFFTIPMLAIHQMQTQINSDGMTDLYIDFGTYVKSFYSVLYSPSSVKISEMGSSYKRLHHQVTWVNTTPCILDEVQRKTTAKTE